MTKLLRRRKKFGRCHVQGHGQRMFCEVCSDIQGTPFTREQEKREWRMDVVEAVYDMNNSKTLEANDGQTKGCS